MTNQPLHNLKAEEQRGQQAEEPSSASCNLYSDLCALEELQRAYAHIKENFQELGIDPLSFETIEAKGVEPFLTQLSNDLQARTYRPTLSTQQSLPATNESEHGGVVALRDLVVQAALKQLLESAFPPAFPSEPQSEKTIQWLTRNINKGLVRVYAVNVNESTNTGQQERLLKRASRHIGDPQLIGLLKEVLTATTQPDHPPQGLLAPLLADIAFEEIDQILQQARTLGREGNFLHVQCTRAANQMVLLLDQDSRYDWLLPAVQKRLREALSKLHYDLAAVETQSVDLTRGGSLRFLGFELRIVKGKHGDAQVQYHLLEERSHGQPDEALPSRRLLGRYHPLRFVRYCLHWMEHQRSWRFVHGAYGRVNAIQVSWRHLPITLYPVLVFLFGWRSPLAWLCLSSIFVCNWRSTVGLVRSAGAWAWRHKLDVVLGACALAALIYLAPLIRDIYANRPREVAASAPVPPGFYVGEYHGDSWWNGEPAPGVTYGLYVPPHLHEAKGPFPLIVFLHDAKGATKRRLFKTGLFAAIANRAGKDAANDRLDFVAFAPIDPTGRWLPESAEVQNILQALDYVIGRHRIDPARVYLTGIANGGDGVWRLAEAYSDKWAALVPVSSSYQPDVQKVRHIPAWIFQEAQDKQATTLQPQARLQELQKPASEVRFTEVSKKPQAVWMEAYRSQTLYDWLAAKKKG
jgi:dienelactone hydrolase